jgi:rod shape-determining protein MreD
VPVARFVLALAAAALAAVAGARLSPFFPLAVDPFLLLAAVVARSGRPLPALLGGTAAGWAADALSGGPFGLFGLADGLVAYGTARAAQQLVVQRKSSLAAIFGAAAAAQGAIVALLGLAFAPGRELPSPLWLAVRVGSTALLGLAWTFLAAAVGRRYATRRRRPAGTVRLDR